MDDQNVPLCQSAGFIQDGVKDGGYGAIITADLCRCRDL